MKPKTGAIWPARDHFDMLLLKLAEELGKLVLGICRGAQIINVAHGGSLYQDVAYRKEGILKHDQQHTPHLPTHGMQVKEGSLFAQTLGKTKFLVNSFHHQLIRKVAPDLIDVAHASDGVIEGLENKDANILAVQWHPEMRHKNPETKFQNNLFKFVIENAK